MTFNKKYVIIILFLSTLSQMPEWKIFKDRDGNKYYLDRNGKIWINDGIEFSLKPVSSLGIDYYLNYGIDLIKRHYQLEGIRILKTIQAMPVTNNRIYQAQIKASKIINEIKKKEGSRYKELDEAASLLIYREGDVFYLINDHMSYSFKIPGPVDIIKKKSRKKIHYSYEGLLLGIRNPDKKGETVNKYDILLAIDSEIFASKFKNITELEINWANNLGFDNFKRKELVKDNNSVIYTFETGIEPFFSGIEGLYMNGNYGYIVRIISAKVYFTKNKDTMMKIIKNFKIVTKY